MARRKHQKHRQQKSAEPARPANRIELASAFKSRKGKLSGGLVALSSAAIISIYTVGRANTSAAYESLTGAAGATADATTSAVTAAPTASTASGTVSKSTATAQPTAAASASYKDGTYTGTGSSRHGGMQVTVVIKNGKIASANVTSCGTRYPCSDVNSLVNGAVNMQKVPANHVSGATDSSNAYKQALTSALAQAKA